MLALLLALGPAIAAAEGYAVAVSNLADGETLWNDARELRLEVAVEPPLAVEQGHRVVVYLDGEPHGGPFADTRILLQDIDRGTHTLSARIVDGAGRMLAESGRLTIYHKQHSALLPSR